MSITPRSDEVTIVFGGDRYRGWHSLDLTHWIDSISTISVVCPFDPSNLAHRELFRPMQYREIEVFVGNEREFRGTVVNVNPTVTASESSVTLEGYATPGVLDQCHYPASSMPLEMTKHALQDVARRVLAPWGIGLDYRAERGAAFDKVAIDVTEKPWEFLSDLAKQRNMVLSNNEAGELLCWRARGFGQPVAKLEQSHASEIKPTLSGDSVFSELTCRTQAKRGKKSSQHTVRNPMLPRVLRPFSIKSDDSDSPDAVIGATSGLGRMLANLAGYDVTGLAGWKSPGGDLWRVNETTLLNAPNAMIYSDYEFLIRGVKRHKTASTESTALNLVLPGAFSATPPEVLPWDE